MIKTIRSYQNESRLDRLVRFAVAELLLLGSYFWLGGIWQIFGYGLGALALFTSLFGICPAYVLLGIRTRQTQEKKLSWLGRIGYGIVLLIIAISGSYYSNFFTKKLFLDDYTRMNTYYKQTLFYTGQAQRSEATANYELLTVAYADFYSKYSAYHPSILKADARFNTDLAHISEIIHKVAFEVTNGDLKTAHLQLEAIRPIFQDIFKRNGFSLLAISLVDFHDAMEKVLAAADAQDISGVKESYSQADLKLKEVEALAQDEEIQAIRQKLDEVLNLADKQDVQALSLKASELKSAFVKVYLKRG